MLYLSLYFLSIFLFLFTFGFLNINHKWITKDSWNNTIEPEDTHVIVVVLVLAIIFYPISLLILAIVFLVNWFLNTFIPEK